MVARKRDLLLIVALVFLLRLPFLHQAVQGDDLYYLYGAQHAQIDPLHPTHVRFIFQGEMADMRGHTHPPLDSWILGGLLAVMGNIRETRFHFAYIGFSLIAALAMYWIAVRLCERPLMATLLFLAVPAFVVNGTSFEADLPFLAFWMSAIALFIWGVDRNSKWMLAGSALAAMIAALAAYQAVFLTPVLAAYLLTSPDRANRTRARWLNWSVTLAAPAGIAIWQFFELVSSGSLPAAATAGILQAHSLHTASKILQSGAALIVHTGWIVSPLLIIGAFWRGGRWRIIAAAVAAIGAAIYDPNPLFWVSAGCGALLLVSSLRRDFVSLWIVIFFACACAVFFAGAARYLLPIAAPVAILMARNLGTGMLAAGFGLQMALSLGLAAANYQHWDADRTFAQSLVNEAAQRRVWINGELGIRYYLEMEGALPVTNGQVFEPGDMIVTSPLVPASQVGTTPLAQWSAATVAPSVPLRLISVEGRSAYSTIMRGLLPFEISRGVVDTLRAEVVVDRKPELSYLDPRDPRAAAQIVAGLYSDGWMKDKASVALKAPEDAKSLSASIYIPPVATARHIQLFADGQLVAEATYPKPDAYILTASYRPTAKTVTVSLTVDRTFTAPGDERKLGVVVVGVGFR